MNHFKIYFCDVDKFWIRHGFPPPRTIERLPQLALENLRSLQIFMSEAMDNFHFPKQHQRLEEIVSLLARFAILARLTVSVVLIDDTDSHKSLASTLGGLRGLKNFYVYLPSSEADTKAQTSSRKKREKAIEKSVMGQKYKASKSLKYANSDRWKVFD